MKTSYGGLLMLGYFFLTASLPLIADPPSAPTGSITRAGPRFDWIRHTELTLTELKSKLNLMPEQLGAWDLWSQGLMNDAHEQVKSKEFSQDQRDAAERWQGSESTPDQMARGISQVHSRIEEMRAHLVQLEATQMRTKTFYIALGKNQQTIFDLFWHEVYHRAAGHDQGFDSDIPDEAETSPGTGAKVAISTAY